MNNAKCFAVATDGSEKRIAITYDVINGSGKVTVPNKKINRIVVDATVLEAIKIVEEYTQNIVDAE